MHKSRFAGIIIDCECDDLDEAARFWSTALGLPIRQGGSDPDIYREFVADDRDMHIEVQKVNHASRVHLDIETDDIEAEVQRLEALGARRIGYVKRWCVMEAPTGQRFCVVNPQGKGFEATAKEWP